MHIEKRRRKYYAIHAIPRDVRHAFGGKAKLMTSLRTEDVVEARIRAAILEPRWRAAIEEARRASGGGAIGDATRFWADMLRTTNDPQERAMIEAAIAGEATRASPAHWRASIAAAPAHERAAVEELAADEAMVRAQLQSLASGEGAEITPQAAADARRWFDQATGRSVRLADYIEPFITKLELAPRTASVRRTNLKAFTDSVPMSGDVSRKTVQAWVTAQSERMSPDTVAKRLAHAKAFWRWLIAQEIILDDDRDHFAHIDTPRLKRTDRAAFEPADIVRLHAAADERGDAPLRDLIAIGAYTGARIDEITSITVKDVRLDDRTLLIKGSKTEAAHRRIPIHPDLLPVVKRLVEASDDGFLLSGLNLDRFGRRSNSIGKRFGSMRDALGYPRTVVFHSIRKTVATLLHDAGIPEQHAAPLLGHRIASMSYGVYSQGVRIETLRTVIEAIKYPGFTPE